LQEARAEIQTLRETISLLQNQGKDHIRQVWRNNCQYVAEVDEELSSKDTEIHRLQESIQEMQIAVALGGHGSSSAVPTLTVTTESRPARCGKAPPVDPFTAEDAKTTLD